MTCIRCSGPEPLSQGPQIPLLSWLTSIGRLCSDQIPSMLTRTFPSLTSRQGLLTQNGMQALKQERMRRTREGAPASILSETEDALVGFFIEGCRFEMQAGHMERAVASIQAALEYTCFAPSIPVGMLSYVVQLMLCCAVLCCAVLCYAVPHCAVLPSCCFATLVIVQCCMLGCAVLCLALHTVSMYQQSINNIASSSLNKFASPQR